MFSLESEMKMELNMKDNHVSSAVMFSIVLLRLTFHIRVMRELSSEGEGTRGGQLLSSVRCVYLHVYRVS